MTVMKQLSHHLTNQLKSFFDIDFATSETQSDSEFAEFDRAVLEREISQLQSTNQIVSIQIKDPTSKDSTTRFLVGRFKRTANHHTFIFELSHSNMIQMIHVDQIVKIAA